MLCIHYWTPELYRRWVKEAQRPVISTEWVHAYGEYRFGGLADVWQTMTSKPAGAGGAIWMWADQGLSTPTKKDRKKYGSIEKDDPYLRINADGWDGIVRSDRTPTADYYETKEVYLPVYPTVDQVVADGMQDIEIPIYNDYSFIDLNTLAISWQLMSDGRLLKSGRDVLDAAPHTTACLTVPAAPLKKVKAGETAHLQLTFIGQEGDTLGHRTVTIDARQYPYARSKKPVTDELIATLHLRPTVWHQLNDGDLTIKKRNFAKGANPEVFQKVEQVGDKTIYTIDSQNTVEAEISTEQQEDGSVIVHYAITPRMEVTYLPLVGLALDLPSAEAPLQWFGWGPENSYPNKHTAQQLGLYNAKGVSETKHMRWLDLQWDRQTLRIGAPTDADGNAVETYFDRDTPQSTTLRIVSRVLGRSEKGRLVVPEWQLTPNQTYCGSFRISLVK